MIRISHRRNTIQQLKDTPIAYGVEIDIRSYGDRLIVQHDPFTEGEDIAEWIKHYKHAFLILNVKEEGLEARLLDIMKKRGIKDFFFLDQSFPFLVKTANQGENRCAVRVSEYESVETAIALAGKVLWVWVDCFTRFPLSHHDAVRLREAGLKLCLVSPELQGKGEVEVRAMQEKLREEAITVDAVCTKQPEWWE